MTDEERQEENRREYNRWLEQQQYRRQDEQWRQTRLEADRAEALRYLRQGDLYLSIYRRDPAAAAAYAERMRENLAYATGHAASSMTAASRADPYVKRAEAEVTAGNYTSALANLNMAITLEPGNAQWYALRSYLHYMLQRYIDAETDATLALSYDTGLAGAYLLRANARIALGTTQAALSDLNAVISRTREYPNAFYQRGDIRLAQEDYAGAERDFSEFLARAPKSGQAYFNRGICRVCLEAFDSAISDFSYALSLFDDELRGAPHERKSAIENASRWAYYWRGNAYYSKGHLAQAIHDFEHFIGLPPQLAPADVTADAYAKRARAKEQLTRYEDVWKIGLRP
jgi:tetratricopeptide (TPR) repeat protein